MAAAVSAHGGIWFTYSGNHHDKEGLPMSDSKITEVLNLKQLLS